MRELWEQRDVLYMLARRDVSARYKQSAIGVFWAVLQPLLLAVVFSVFFGHFAHVPSEPGVPYAPFAVSGMVLWLFFSAAMSGRSESTVANEKLISKVYFPRVIIPLAAVVLRWSTSVSGSSSCSWRCSCTGSCRPSRSF